MEAETKKLLLHARATGLTDDEICRLAGINYTTLWRWERGKFIPSLKKFMKLQRAINRHAHRS